MAEEYSAHQAAAGLNMVMLSRKYSSAYADVTVGFLWADPLRTNSLISQCLVSSCVNWDNDRYIPHGMITRNK